MNNDKEQPSRVVPENALTSEGDLHLVITESCIVATMTGTDFLVEYRKVKRTPRLVVSQMRGGASTKKAEFLAWAWRAANEEARALGWII
jgi:hypothetical protein